LAEERDAITLICPDPSRLAFGGLPIVLTKDPEDEKVETADGRSARSIARFMTFDDKQWFIGECDEQPPGGPYGVHCQPARRSTWQNMTVLQGSGGEHRVYRFGGRYVGQGGGVVEYLFFVGKRRVGLSSEEAPIADRLQSQGPVLFEGDDVTARLVRSVRPR
jgi:hypothetical protein